MQVNGEPLSKQLIDKQTLSYIQLILMFTVCWLDEALQWFYFKCALCKTSVSQHSNSNQVFLHQYCVAHMLGTFVVYIIATGLYKIVRFKWITSTYTANPTWCPHRMRNVAQTHGRFTFTLFYLGIGEYTVYMFL